MNIFVALLIFTVIVVIHELGHFFSQRRTVSVFLNFQSEWDQDLLP